MRSPRTRGAPSAGPSQVPRLTPVPSGPSERAATTHVVPGSRALAGSATLADLLGLLDRVLQRLLLLEGGRSGAIVRKRRSPWSREPRRAAIGGHPAARGAPMPLPRSLPAPASPAPLPRPAVAPPHRLGTHAHDAHGRAGGSAHADPRSGANGGAGGQLHCYDWGAVFYGVNGRVFYGVNGGLPRKGRPTRSSPSG